MRGVLVLLLLSGCATDVWRDFYNEERTERLTASERALVRDIQACRYFDSEYPYDADRRAFLDRRMAQTCPRIAERRAAVLRGKGASADTVRVVEQAWCDEDACGEGE